MGCTFTIRGMRDMVFEAFITITKALADPQRVRALVALRGGELCVCQIIELLGLAPSTVSKHMAVLRLAGLVRSRKEERWMYYRLPDEHERSTEVQGALGWIFKALEKDETVCRDAAQLEQITRQNPSRLCKRQRGG
jgi:ArsR family transcriptional regulator, arsenate/arsenite/antimonite-responsive transcriptional repressor